MNGHVLMTTSLAMILALGAWFDKAFAVEVSCRQQAVQALQAVDAQTTSLPGMLLVSGEHFGKGGFYIFTDKAAYFMRTLRLSPQGEIVSVRLKLENDLGETRFFYDSDGQFAVYAPRRNRTRDVKAEVGIVSDPSYLEKWGLMRCFYQGQLLRVENTKLGSTSAMERYESNIKEYEKTIAFYESVLAIESDVYHAAELIGSLENARSLLEIEWSNFSDESKSLDALLEAETEYESELKKASPL